MTVRELAEKLDGTVEGDGDAMLTGLASLDAAGPNEVTFVVDGRRAAQLADCRASAVIAGPNVPKGSLTLIRVKDVQAATAMVLAALADPDDLPAPGVHPSAIVPDDVALGKDVAIGPHAVIGSGASLADGVVICANASVGAKTEIGRQTVLYEGTTVGRGCRIGRRCRIGPNAVIGSSGFGYYFAEGRQIPVPHVGIVEIGDDVDIGACSCVDRAKFGATRIGEGSKIDNLVQVAHNVQIGKGCIIAGCSGIAGSAVLKDHVILGGHVGVRDNITLGTGAKSGAFTAIAKDVPDGSSVLGVPAMESGKTLRTWLEWMNSTGIRKSVKKLEKRLDALESSKDH